MEANDQEQRVPHLYFRSGKIPVHELKKEQKQKEVESTSGISKENNIRK